MKVVNAITILEEIQTTGHSPLKIQGDDGNIYIVKKRKHFQADTEMVSEFLCNYLCRQWGIKTPECKFVSVSRELIMNDSTLSGRHNVKHYENYLCFGSQFMPNAIDLQLSDLNYVKGSRSLYNDITELLKIGLFDLWVVNIDRKPTNLNLMKQILPNGKFGIVAIDHAYSFDTLRYDQLTPDLELSFNESILFLDIVNAMYKEQASQDFENLYHAYFLESISRCETGIEDFLNEIKQNFQEEQEFFLHLKRFLFDKDRNGTIFADFLRRLK
ncbi:MAG: hypothetical protein IPN79_15190 [Saprospiraceae bacterium]|nr:hypothetical protein [Saprospiraceae bacterium]